LISSGKLQPRSALYQGMNLVGAVGLAINSGWNGAWPSAGLNIVWLGIAVVAMRRNSRRAT
jgi:Na+/proline symporter